jgi:hypothetical protein
VTIAVGFADPALAETSAGPLRYEDERRLVRHGPWKSVDPVSFTLATRGN